MNKIILIKIMQTIINSLMDVMGLLLAGSSHIQTEDKRHLIHLQNALYNLHAAASAAYFEEEAKKEQVEAFDLAPLRGHRYLYTGVLEAEMERAKKAHDQELNEQRARIVADYQHIERELAEEQGGLKKLDVEQLKKTTHEEGEEEN